MSNHRIRERITQKFSKDLVSGAIAGVLFSLLPMEAMGFDLDAAGKAVTDPVVKFINDYWPAGVMAVGSGGAIAAQGDLRTRAIGFGVGAGLAGLVMMGVKIGLGIK